MRDEVRLLSAQSRPAAGEGAAGRHGLPPAVQETVEAIVGAVGDGDDLLIDRLLTRFTQIADFNALIHLRTRLHTTLRATVGECPDSTLPVVPGGRSSLCEGGRVGLRGRQAGFVSER
ncbi:hypothetical protein [Streptomyces xanthophaeus]|uniref:hypothetical protein n=1 Tax=Streptomyces xanthophaeus TaxID=67385 RepID=UPI00233EC548|nr:hypothetical protein [Streptomyces xanthophaeus]